MIQMTEVIGRMRRKADNKKLILVLSTKLSIEDHKTFGVLTNLTYRYGGIKEDAPSEMLRYIISPVVELLRKQSGFSLLLTHPLKENRAKGKK
jgi:hypothetical protein